MSYARSEKAMDFMAYLNGPSSVPGLTGNEVVDGSAGQGKKGHSLYEHKSDEDKRRLSDPALHARVAFWLKPNKFTLKEIKMECKSKSVPITGNKKVLALRLAFKKLPEDVAVAEAEGYTVTQSAPFKRGGKRVKGGKSSETSKVNKPAQGAKKR